MSFVQANSDNWYAGKVCLKGWVKLGYMSEEKCSPEQQSQKSMAEPDTSSSVWLEEIIVDMSLSRMRKEL